MSVPTHAQLYSYTSSLAGALTPRIKPYYELPQDAHHADARTDSSVIKPIIFELSNGRPWVPLDMLLGSIEVLERDMVGGSDRVFGNRVGPIKVGVRVMWPGYTGETMIIWFNAGATTRAVLAKSVAYEVNSYMKMVSMNPSNLDKYQIGPNGIQSRNVLLGGIKYMDNLKDTWQATIFIDNFV